MDKYNQGQEEPSARPENEMDETDLGQVSGGFDPQPEPPALMQKGSQSNLQSVAQKKAQKVWGDPHIHN